MATDKDATARFLGAGTTARAVARPSARWLSFPRRVCWSKSTDDPATFSPTIPALRGNCGQAAASAEARLPLSIHYPARVDSRLLAEILQHQWRENLGVETQAHAA